MNKDEIELYDWHRIFIGEVPPSFFIEVVIRISVIYFLLIVAMRLMGKRMSTQLNAGELAALVTLAAAIGVPIQAPDRGILPAIIIVIIVVVIQRLLAGITARNENLEKVTQGKAAILVEDSKLNLKVMKRNRISRERLFSQLRSQGITNLGKVKRVALEASGAFTIVKDLSEKPGLTLIPYWDNDFQNQQIKSYDALTCIRCGNIMNLPFDKQTPCSHCHESEWVDAFVSNSI